MSVSQDSHSDTVKHDVLIPSCILMHSCSIQNPDTSFDSSFCLTPHSKSINQFVPLTWVSNPLHPFPCLCRVGKLQPSPAWVTAGHFLILLLPSSRSPPLYHLTSSKCRGQLVQRHGLNPRFVGKMTAPPLCGIQPL